MGSDPLRRAAVGSDPLRCGPLRVCGIAGSAGLALPTVAGDGASRLARLAFAVMHGTFHAGGREHADRAAPARATATTTARPRQEMDTGELAGGWDPISAVASHTRSLM